MLLKTDSPNPASGAGVKKAAYDSLDDESREWVDNLAREVTELFQSGITARALLLFIAGELGDSEMEFKLALWWKLDSKVRTFLDKAEKK